MKESMKTSHAAILHAPNGEGICGEVVFEGIGIINRRREVCPALVGGEKPRPYGEICSPKLPLPNFLRN